MVEADSHFKLHPASILDMNKMFEHIDILSMSIQSSLIIQSCPHYLAQILGFWVSHMDSKDVF
jgi:hypothetical protein